jgi:hypothetical protein
MIPAFEPREIESFGEKLLYKLLRRHLPEDFTVIHSLPWLCSAVKQIDSSYAPTGEIDFLVIHPKLGVLALEVKSGKYRISGQRFILIKPETVTDPIKQTRHNVHGLARYLGTNPDLRFKIAYGLVFPDSAFGDALISTALTDISVDPPQAIFIDKPQIPNLAERVIEIMRFWKSTNHTPELDRHKLEKLISTLCPDFDGSPEWATRALYDNKLWLRLTPEQSAVVEAACNRQRIVITGWPGTGKTLIGIEFARQQVASGKRVLVITFNSLLAEHLRLQTGFESNDGYVSTWHGLCSTARKKLGITGEPSQTWLKKECEDDLISALSNGLMENYDALLLDEAQALRPEWCETLVKWFCDKPIVAMCDETQVFSFETGTTQLNELCAKLGVEHPFVLTIALRTPRAVTNRLMSVKEVSYQLTSPRELEPDAVQELLVDNMENALFSTIQELQKQNLLGTDIVVLTKFGLDIELVDYLQQTFGVQSQTVSRFRGLEAPAIIIVSADTMDDAELFSGYSRATSVCIALYEIEAIGDAKNSAFQEILLADSLNEDRVRQAKLKSHTTNILAGNFIQQQIPLGSVNLAWFSGWKSWLVELQDEDEPSILWVDYLVSHHKWPVYFWNKSSRRKVYLASPEADMQGDIYASELRLRVCEKCKEFTPHYFALKTAGWTCIFCSKHTLKLANEPSASIFQQLESFDRIIQIQDLSPATKTEIGSLPVSLAALRARRCALAKAKNHILDAHIPYGRIMYRAALAFVHSRIIFMSPGTRLSLSDIASESHTRYTELANTLSLASWKGIVANALNRYKEKGLLKKVEKGIYETVGN